METCRKPVFTGLHKLRNVLLNSLVVSAYILKMTRNGGLQEHILCFQFRNGSFGMGFMCNVSEWDLCGMFRNGIYVECFGMEMLVPTV